MSILGKFRMGGGTKDTDIEDFLGHLGLEEGDMLEEQADMWIRPLALEDVIDVEKVNDELKKGNIVLLNIEPLYKKNTIKLRQAVSEIKGTIHDINGDIARLSDTKVLVTPANVKIAKK